MPANGFMNAQAVIKYWNQKKATAVFFVPTQLYHAHLFKKAMIAAKRMCVVDNNTNNKWFRWLTLFTTSGTLLCCALPILLVSLGLGSVVASMNYNIPGMFWLAQHKYWTIALSACMLAFLAWMIWRPTQSCPTDPELARYCETSKKWNKRIFWLSVIIWSTGFFFSTLLLPLRNLLGV